MKVLRSIGPGDREHVRSQLLSVCIASPQNLIEQVLGAMVAGAELGMMARIFVNVSRLENKKYNELISLFHRNTVPQLIECFPNKELYGFLPMTRRFDLTVLLDQDESVTTLEVKRALREKYFEHGKRFLEGNFAKLTDEQILAAHPFLITDFKEVHAEFTRE